MQMSVGTVRRERWGAADEPAPPVISTRDTLSPDADPHGRTPDDEIGEAMLPHDTGSLQVATSKIGGLRSCHPA
jgi:hypothetical protein